MEIENYKVSQYQEIIQINREIEEQNRLQKNRLRQASLIRYTGWIQ